MKKSCLLHFNSHDHIFMIKVIRLRKPIAKKIRDKRMQSNHYL